MWSVGCKSVVRGSRNSKIMFWTKSAGVRKRSSRMHRNVAAVALANKLAGIAWSVLAKNEQYRPWSGGRRSCSLATTTKNMISYQVCWRMRRWHRTECSVRVFPIGSLSELQDDEAIFKASVWFYRADKALPAARSEGSGSAQSAAPARSRDLREAAFRDRTFLGDSQNSWDQCRVRAEPFQGLRDDESLTAGCNFHSLEQEIETICRSCRPSRSCVERAPRQRKSKHEYGGDTCLLFRKLTQLPLCLGVEIVG